MIRTLIVLSLAFLLAACDNSNPTAASSTTGQTLTPVTLVLNWVPEPEFGGFYAAQHSGIFKKFGLDVSIKPGGPGTPTAQMVGAGQVEFGISSGDEVVIARSRGNNLVAIFAGYQDCPQGLMTHSERGFTSLADVFAKEGTIAMEIGLPYAQFLKNKYGFEKVKVVPYAGGLTQFLADPNMSQQCFVFSEPLSARKQGVQTKTFLVAESGYNPYTTVVVTRDDYLKAHRDVAGKFAAACRDGWALYLADPAPTNKIMHEMNKVMDEETFAAAAEAQKLLVMNPAAKQQEIGEMKLDRWKTLADQLVELKVIEKAPPAADCFVDFVGVKP